jgi:hypothetical protein
MTELTPEDPGTVVDITEDVPIVEPYSGESWDTLVTGADEAFGGELEKAESLIGIPFIIVRMTYRLGDFARIANVDPRPGDYVSIDLITAPADVIAKRRERGRIPEGVNADPDEHLVLNLSGTGAYRQLVSYLEARRLIVLPEGPDGGEFGASRLDTPVAEWKIFQTAKIGHDAEGHYQSAEFDVRLRCPRGLRVSQFDNRHGKDIEVYYLG